MILYRILCAFLMAWAVNWALSRPEAFELVTELPELAALGPISAALVGYFSLSARQGWGVVVAVANGIWAGALSIILSGAIFMLIQTVKMIRANMISSFDSFVRVFIDNLEPLVELGLNLPLLTVSLGAAAVVGVATEFLHWLLVRLRRKKARPTTG